MGGYDNYYRAWNFKKDALKQAGVDPLRAGILFTKAAREYLTASKLLNDPSLSTFAEECADLALRLKNNNTQINTTSSSDTSSTDSWLLPSIPKIKFKDVAGENEAKRFIYTKFIAPYKFESKAKEWKRTAKGGILLYGPPGTGKTYLAKATAGEIGCPFYNISALEILSQWVGESEKNVGRLFKDAQSKKQAIIFLDEIDSICANRDQDSQGHERRVVNQLLREMDGISGLEGVLIMGATNAPWLIDPSFLRPGRFDKSYYIGLPKKAARELIFQMNLKDLPTEGLNYELLASSTEGYSGADIKGICDEVGDNKFEESIRGKSSPITMQNIEKVISQTPASIKPEDLARYTEFSSKRSHVSG